MDYWVTMSNPQTVEFRLQGLIPSKKNSRINTKSGASFPSKDFTNWQQESIIEVRRQSRHRFTGHLHIELIIYFGTLGKADTDNKVTSILDMLVEAMTLRDDYWESVSKTSYEADYRKDKPGAFFRITELPDDFFGSEYAIASKKRNKRNIKKLGL